MFAPEEQQIEICLLKSNLEEIENDLVVQRSALPALDVESEQQYRETMNALRVARSINSEVERLKQENGLTLLILRDDWSRYRSLVRLIAKRMQLKRQCEEASKALEVARENRNILMNQLNLVEREEEEQIRNYEDVLREKADRFRKARVFYNEGEMNVEINNMEKANAELSDEVGRRETKVADLYRQLDVLSSEVPDDIVVILGKLELSDKLKTLTERCVDLEDKRRNLVILKNRRGHYNP